MKPNLVKHIRKQLKKRLFPIAKWLTKEILSGLAVAAAVAVATSWVVKSQAVSTEREQLGKLHLGLGQQYIDSVFGVPMIQFRDEGSRTDIQIYKLKKSVVWCAFDKEQQIVAYVIIVQTGRLYKVPPNLYRNKSAYLTQFTYADFSEEGEHIELNKAANNDAYTYYSERYYGAGPANYNYYLIGSYKDSHRRNHFAELLGYEHVEDPPKELRRLRGKARPNAFGMIKNGYEDAFSLIPASENLRVYAEALFSSWQ